jgi:hypothetical protein
MKLNPVIILRNRTQSFYKSVYDIVNIWLSSNWGQLQVHNVSKYVIFSIMHS